MVSHPYILMVMEGIVKEWEKHYKPLTSCETSVSQACGCRHILPKIKITGRERKCSLRVPLRRKPSTLDSAHLAKHSFASLRLSNTSPSTLDSASLHLVVRLTPNAYKAKKLGENINALSQIFLLYMRSAYCLNRVCAVFAISNGHINLFLLCLTILEVVSSNLRE